MSHLSDNGIGLKLQHSADGPHILFGVEERQRFGEKINRFLKCITKLKNFNFCQKKYINYICGLQYTMYEQSFERIKVETMLTFKLPLFIKSC